jgi:hypothetical protein
MNPLSAKTSITFSDKIVSFSNPKIHRRDRGERREKITFEDYFPNREYKRSPVALAEH